MEGLFILGIIDTEKDTSVFYSTLNSYKVNEA